MIPDCFFPSFSPKGVAQARRDETRNACAFPFTSALLSLSWFCSGHRRPERRQVECLKRAERIDFPALVKKNSRKGKGGT